MKLWYLIIGILLLIPVTFAYDKDVFIVAYDPILEIQSGAKLSQFINGTYPLALSQSFMQSFATDSPVQYHQSSYVEIDGFPPYVNHVYSDSSYLNCYFQKNCPSPQIDYDQLFATYDLCNANIDEVWIFGGPYFGLNFALMTGSDAIDLTAPKLSICNTNVVIMGMSYESNDEWPYFSYAKRVEKVLQHFLGLSTYDEFDGQRFRYSQTGICTPTPINYADAHCGNTEFPPNTRCKQSYNDSSAVWSDCHLFENYPEVQGLQQQVSCSAWGCNQLGYLRWWIKNVPDTPGSQDGIQTNWWDYIVGESQYLPVITLRTPQRGYAQTSTFTFSIETSKPSSCKYSGNSQTTYEAIVNPNSFFTTQDGLYHTLQLTLNAADNVENVAYVYCKTTTGYQTTPFPITLIVDRTPPVLMEYKVNPQTIIESLSTQIEFKAAEPITCQLLTTIADLQTAESVFLTRDDFNQSYSIILDSTTTPALVNNKNYTFFGICMNQAGLVSVPVPFNISVNLGAPNRIIDKFPIQITNPSSVTIGVRTNKDATCSYRENGAINSFPQTNTKLHQIERLNLADGEYTYDITCVFEDLGSQSTTLSFIIDKVAPQNTQLTHGSTFCPYEQIEIYATAQDQIGVSSFDYTVFSGQNSLMSGTSNGTILFYVPNGTQTIYVEVIAKDAAGNTAYPKNSNPMNILSSNDATCRVNLPPQVSYTQSNVSTGILVNLGCDDEDLFNCDIAYAFKENCLCETTCNFRPYFTSISLDETSILCVKVTDSANLSTIKELSFTLNSCTTDNDGCCVELIDGICDLDCIDDLDCTVNEEDLDNDGMPDSWELSYGLDITYDDSLDDLDLDGLANIDEYKEQTNPNNPDTDGDGVEDYDEILAGTDPTLAENKVNDDEDGDGISIQDEIFCETDPQINDKEVDSDNDGLTNYEECVIYNSLVHVPDTDGDGVLDGDEVNAGTSPNDPNDKPSSHLLHIAAFILGGIALGAGVYLFIMNNKSTTFSTAAKPLGNSFNVAFKKPLINFGHTQKEMANEVKHAQPQHSSSVLSTPPIDVDKSDILDEKIKKQRDKLKLKKMGTIFDEFAQDDDYLKNHEIFRKKDKDVFKKLDTMDKK